MLPTIKLPNSIQKCYDTKTRTPISVLSNLTIYWEGTEEKG